LDALSDYLVAAQVAIFANIIEKKVERGRLYVRPKLRIGGLETHL